MTCSKKHPMRIVSHNGKDTRYRCFICEEEVLVTVEVTGTQTTAGEILEESTRIVSYFWKPDEGEFTVGVWK